jgi:CPA1 family monovalent cation:H+ antiporter
MENLLIVLLLIVLALTVKSYGGQQSKYYSDLFVLLVASAISFIPRFSNFVLHPDIIFGIAIPPLIFLAAKQVKIVNFLRVKRLSVALGVFGVIFTMFFAAITTNFLIPQIAIPSALVLGAIISPTDPISAISIGGKMNLRQRVMNCIMSESLLNDAIAISLFTVTLAKVESDANNGLQGNIVFVFLYSVVVGVMVGIFCGFIAFLFEKLIKRDMFNVLLVFSFTFITFIIADLLHASGIISVIIFCFVYKHTLTRETESYIRFEDNFWKLVEFLFETFVFGYIGLESHTLYTNIKRHYGSNWKLVGISTIVLLVIILVRFATVFLFNYIFKLEKKFHKVQERTFSTKECIMISWASMRGLIALALISKIVFDASSFPFFDAIQFIATFCILGTLLIQGFTMPFVIKKLGLSIKNFEIKNKK